jgi:hypothetical protein
MFRIPALGLAQHEVLCPPSASALVLRARGERRGKGRRTIECLAVLSDEEGGRFERGRRDSDLVNVRNRLGERGWATEREG